MHWAGSGENALQQLANGFEPQLIVILSDINLLEMDGQTLLGEIKKRFPNIPVMMVTADSDDEHRRASDPGAVDFDALKAQLRQLSTAVQVQGRLQ
jgi:CheY-like chemotaxis protein